MDDLVKAVDREEYARKENKLKVGQAGGDAAARWLESRKLRWVSPSLFPSLFSFSPFFSSPPFSHFRGVNSTYAGASVVCEFLYGLNIFVQWWMVDAFLGRCSSFPDFHSLFLCYTISLYRAPIGHWEDGDFGQVISLLHFQLLHFQSSTTIGSRLISFSFR